MKKAQATLEFSLIFIIIVALIAGILNLWTWSHNQIGARQGAYEDSRVAAGSKASPGKPSTYGAGDITDERTYLFRK